MALKYITVMLMLVLSIPHVARAANDDLTYERFRADAAKESLETDSNHSMMAHNPANIGSDSLVADMADDAARTVDSIYLRYVDNEDNLSRTAFDKIKKGNQKSTISINEFSTKNHRDYLNRVLKVRQTLKSLELNDWIAIDLYNFADSRRGVINSKALDRKKFLSTKLPEDLDGYRLLGCTQSFNKFRYHAIKDYDTIRCVYTNNNNTLIIDESHVGKRLLAIDEFVTDRINNHPVFSYKLKSLVANKKASYIELAINNSYYAAYIVGNNVDYFNDKKVLFNVAKNIITMNAD